MVNLHYYFNNAIFVINLQYYDHGTTATTIPLLHNTVTMGLLLLILLYLNLADIKVPIKISCHGTVYIIYIVLTSEAF